MTYGTVPVPVPYLYPKNFSTYILAAELSKFLSTLIAYQKCKLAVAAKSAKWGKKKLAVFR